MRRALAFLAFALAPVLAATAFAQGSAGGERPACVRATGSARWAAAGYNHSVTVENACDYAVRCEVSTDVNPTVQTVALPAGASRTVTTFLDAPGSGFVPRVDCTR